MKNYNEELENILKDYDLPQISTTMIEEMGDRNLEVLEARCTNRKIAFWGAGEGKVENNILERLLKEYATYFQNAICFIDSNPILWGTTILELPVISPSDIEQWDIEVIVVTSGWTSQKQIVKACKQFAPNHEIVVPNLAMFEVAYRESNLYLHMNLIRIEYENSLDLCKKEKYLKELIALFLYIKDFNFAFFYMDLYILENYKDKERLIKLKDRVYSLLLDMSKSISMKKRDILIFFADRMNKEESKKVNMFSYLEEDALCFENANATGLYTYESMTSILRGQMPLDEDIYSQTLSHNVEQIPIIKDVMEKGYKIFVNSIQGYPIFEGNQVNVTYSSFVSEKLWIAFCNMCENKGSVLEYLYVYESHHPELCPYHKGKTYQEILEISQNLSKHYRTNYHDCLKYIDNVLGFYYKLFPKDMILVIHSDHSFQPTDATEIEGHDKWLLSKKYCVEIPLLIKGAGVTGKYKDMFSMIDFTKIMLQIINKQKLEIPKRKYINYQMHPIHSKPWRKELIESGMEKYIDGVNIFVSNEFIFLISANKWEEIYRVGNVYDEIADTREGQEIIKRINSMRFKNQK